jgi:predicted dehydrogenase
MAAPFVEAGVTVYKTLEEMLRDERVQMVSLCSPLRSEQAGHAVAAMNAGKHVLAEKPSATREADLDAIIATAKRTGRIFHEQVNTAFEQPYATLRGIVKSGVLGTIVQVYAQKSYPWRDSRPQDEAIDGGLATQAGVYCTRFVEHVAGERIASIHSAETKLGNPNPTGQCRRAVSFLMTLKNGGLASGVANYLGPDPQHWGRWGYEICRIWGTNGMVESVDFGRIGTLAVHGESPRTIDLTTPVPVPFFDRVIEEMLTGKPATDFDLETELSPTRWVIRAKN